MRRAWPLSGGPAWLYSLREDLGRSSRENRKLFGSASKSLEAAYPCHPLEQEPLEPLVELASGSSWLAGLAGRARRGEASAAGSSQGFTSGWCSRLSTSVCCLVIQPSPAQLSVGEDREAAAVGHPDWASSPRFREK